MPSIAQPDDHTFEITFADLAHAQLRDKAPALLDYLLGFQVIDSNDDQTHAIGVMGFKIGEQMLYVPSFFLNGELKQSLIYIKGQDLFVPLQDNWVTYLLNRRPMVMGESEPRRETELGVSQPDLSPLSNAMGGRGSGVGSFGMTRSANFEPWMAGAEGMFTKLATRYTKLPTLPDFLRKTANDGMSGVLAKAMREDTRFGNAVLKYYEVKDLMFKPASIDPVKAGLERMGFTRQPSHVKRSSVLHDPNTIFNKSGSHRVQVLHGTAQDKLLADDEMETLARGDLLFKDAREDANVAYRTDEGFRLTNPDINGVYDLLLSNGKYTKVSVFINPRAAGKGYVRVALVVDHTSKNFGYWWLNQLYAKPADDGKNPFDAKGVNSLSAIKPGSVYTIIDKNGEATTAFKVTKKVSGGKSGMTELYVTPIVRDPGRCPQDEGHIDAERVSQFGPGSKLPMIGDVTVNTGRKDVEENGNGDAEKPSFINLNHIVITNDDRNIRVVGNTLFVPSTAKAIKLTEGEKLNTWAMSDPSSLLDVEANLLKEGAEQLKVLRKGIDYFVNDNVVPFDRIDFITSLVKSAGLRGTAAVSLVDGLKDDVRTRFLIKNAVGYAPPIPEPQYGYDSYAGVSEQYPQDEQLPVGMPMPSTEGYLGKPERDQIMEAAQTGQQDVFDTSAIASLVNTSDNDDMISQYLSDMILGLDRVCRILFMFYWMNEKFRDRYGQENLVELEDQLKNVSKALGDLILFLKQRTVEGSPSFDAMEIEMGAGQR